ncbi:MAG: hypothetical protein K2O49_08940, partial [Muribaculaceae bacterium]|nr:hypothetical protein [Muribaculaceae bacterium]
SVGAFAQNPAQITTVPSPAVATKALEVKITTSDMGQEVYCYSWCEVNGSEISPWEWAAVNTSKFRMTGNGGSYTIKIDNIQEFYGLSDDQLEGLTKLGFIAKTPGGNQTEDCFVNVEQGPREAYAGGYGTADSPYILTTSAHLAQFSTTSRDWSEDTYVKLGADIDGVVLTSPIGSTGSPFKGHFDGAGYSIKNVNLSSTTLGASVGLFGALSGGEIINLGVTDANMAGVNNVGTLVGTAISGKIERCFATGKVTGNSICVGGLIGENIGATVSDCYAGVVVSNEDDYATGGIVGKNTGAVKNVYATGEISGKDYVGGIVGANYGSIRNSVALNTGVFGDNDYAARFGGNNNSQNQVSANHSWDGMSRGPANWPMHGDHATDKKASELIDFTTFKTLTGWDFDNVWEWRNEDGKPYPVLRNLSNQTNTIPASFFASSAVEEIFEADKVMITAGPNPFADYVTVRCSEPLATVDVYSLAGGKMATVNGKGSMELTVDMSGASDGMY